MRSFFARFRKSAEPTDAETAETMRRLGGTFISGMADEGYTFTWESTEVSRLDDLCDEFRAADPPAEVRHSIIMGMGAYLGELLVRHGDGRWAYDPAERAAVVDMPNDLRAYPHNKVAKRLDIGPEHDLLAFYWYSMTKDTPPGTQLRTLPDSAE